MSDDRQETLRAPAESERGRYSLARNSSAAGGEVRALRSINERSQDSSGGASGMTVKWQPENAAGTLWSATVADGQQGWFEIQMERSPDGWDWVINHDRRF